MFGVTNCAKLLEFIGYEFKKLESRQYERELILKLYKERKSYREFANVVNRSKSTIQCIIKQMQKNILNGEGCSRKLTHREEKKKLFAK